MTTDRRLSIAATASLDSGGEGAVTLRTVGMLPDSLTVLPLSILRAGCGQILNSILKNQHGKKRGNLK